MTAMSSLGVPSTNVSNSCFPYILSFNAYDSSNQQHLSSGQLKYTERLCQRFLTCDPIKSNGAVLFINEAYVRSVGASCEPFDPSKYQTADAPPVYIIGETFEIEKTNILKVGDRLLYLAPRTRLQLPHPNIPI